MRLPPSGRPALVLATFAALATALPVRADPCVDYGDYLHLTGAAHTPGFAYDVAIDGDRAVVAGNHAGVTVVNLAGPGGPVIDGTIDTPGLARGIAVTGNLAYVADWTAGFQVVDISSPGAPAIIGHCDTPGGACAVASSGRFAFVADSTAGVQIEVFDATGRLIDSVPVQFSDGRGEATWNGVDAHGRAVASGMYFARLGNDPRVGTIRVLVIR